MRMSSWVTDPVQGSPRRSARLVSMRPSYSHSHAASDASASRAQLARVDAVLVQALIAAALSFAHRVRRADTGLAAGGVTGTPARTGTSRAWAYPVSIDLLLVAAWRRLRSGTVPGSFAWISSPVRRSMRRTPRSTWTRKMTVLEKVTEVLEVPIAAATD